ADHAGEISRQLQGTRIAERTEDHQIIADDYPLLPVRRRFWEQCFRQIDAAGTHSQLRSQLRIIHDAVAKLSDKPLGFLVPADELYEALAPEMVNTGVLLREINERIIRLGASGEKDGPLARRVCGLVFLIGKVRRDDAGDIGVRATKEHIADLLVDDLTADNGKLRSNVEQVLDRLAAEGALLKVDDEYRLQTREGSEWDGEFRKRQAKLGNDDAAIQFQRDQLLYAEFDKIVRSVKSLQGAAKEARALSIHREQTPPPVDGQAIPVWIRDGWSCQRKEHVEAARSAGSDSPTIFVYLPRKSAKDLRRFIVDADAARQTLDAKGTPSTDEGRDARQGMSSRLSRATTELDALVREIIANVEVFQGGGNDVFGIEPSEKLRTAAEASLIRLFPRFKEADASAKTWEAVLKRARDGAEQPFQPTGHTEATEKHPICQQVIAAIGAGRTGSDIRKELKSSPFGWPQDAIDAALMALHRLQHITAVQNGAPLAPGQLDQNKIAKAEFRVERATLSVQDRLALRKLYGKAGISCKSGEEAATASVFLNRLFELARSAGGQPPLPAPVGLTVLEDLEKLVGNEQLVAIKDRAKDLEARIDGWTALSDLAEARQPVWDLATHLARHAKPLAAAKTHLEQVQAIEDQRLLLDTADHVSPLRKALADLLRGEVNRLHAENVRVYDEASEALAAHDAWARLSQEDQAVIMVAVGLFEPVQPSVKTDEELAEHLDACSLAATRAETDAIAGRVSRAIQRAAKLLEPKVQTVTLERSTLRTAADVDAWLARQKKRMLAALKEGPVLVD
ncbi:MAG: BREX system P-loop protein BrxC, partial [Planctomycetota bacterium]